MKNPISILCLAAFMTLAAITSSFSQTEKFEIKSPFKKSTYNGKELRHMSNKELNSILSLDPSALSKYRGGKALSGTATALICIGSALVLYNTLQEASSISSGGYGSDQTLSTVGIGLIVASIPFTIIGGIVRKNAIRNFRAVNKKEITMHIAPAVYHSKNFIVGVKIAASF